MLRLKKLSEVIGQSKAVENIRMSIEMAKARNKRLGNVLLYGPRGIGKETLAYVIASELDVGIRVFYGGNETMKVGDFAAVLMNVSDNDIIFIDDIHMLNDDMQEILYQALEYHTLDVYMGKKITKINLAPFILIGGTTNIKMMPKILINKFENINKLNIYSRNELKMIIERFAMILEVVLDEAATEEIAKCSHGSPHISYQLLNQVLDSIKKQKIRQISKRLVINALDSSDVDIFGLHEVDRLVINTIIGIFEGGPVWADMIEVALGEKLVDFNRINASFLQYLGFINRTERGYVATRRAYDYCSISKA